MTNILLAAILLVLVLENWYTLKQQVPRMQVVGGDVYSVV